MSKEIIYKCPRLEEKKRAEQELNEELQCYFDNKCLLRSPYPYVCPGCTGGLKSRVTKDQQCTCALIIDTEQVNWKNKKTIRMMRTIAKAIRRQKRREGRQHHE